MKIKTPYAKLLPLLATSEREALAADLKKNGQLYPILIDETGAILDGHNRYSILKTKATTKTIRGLDENEKIAFVYRHALTRRNLSTDQKREIDPAMKKHALKQAVAKWLTANTTGCNGSKPDARVKLSPAAKSEAAERHESGESQTTLQSCWTSEGVQGHSRKCKNFRGWRMFRQMTANEQRDVIPERILEMIELPYPPSANSLNSAQASKSGQPYLCKTAAHRVYPDLVKACWFSDKDRPMKIPHPLRVAMTIILHPGNRHKQDIDNRCKPILDALTGLAYDDDSQVDQILILRGAKDKEKCGHAKVLIDQLTVDETKGVAGELITEHWQREDPA